MEVMDMMLGMFGLISGITSFLMIILGVACVIGDDPVEDAKQVAKILGAWLLIAVGVCFLWSMFFKWFIFSYLPWLFS